MHYKYPLPDYWTQKRSEESETFSAFLEAVWESYGSGEWTAKDVVRIASYAGEESTDSDLDIFGELVDAATESKRTAKIGKLLGKKKETPYNFSEGGTLSLEKTNTRSKNRTHWRITHQNAEKG